MLNFQKLTPISEVDISVYEDALDYVFSESDVRNVAISGAYSSGKSSVIGSYEKRHSRKKFMHISLAHFRSLDDTENVGVSNEMNVYEEAESVIEGKILNQLIQQIPFKKIPRTNFRIKSNMGFRGPFLISLLIISLILSSLFLCYFDQWSSYVNALNNEKLKFLLSFTISDCVPLVCFCVIGIILWIGIYKLVRLQLGRNVFRKFSLQGNEIEIFSDDNDSYFDKYLNEVLYLFENSGIDVIVFEDIDRFENTTIFERLREINTLVNIRLSGANKVLRFFYLLRDDMFDNKDRVKFFDYIIPIVPVIDGSNSYDKFKEYLGEFFCFDDHFLRGLCLYIDDLRLLKNIYNEFLIYKNKLDVIELDHNKLLAIITYKNIFPRDFAELQLNRGFIHNLFQCKAELCRKRMEQFSIELEEVSQRIARCEAEILESEQELDYVDSGKRNAVNGYYYGSHERNVYSKWKENDYPARKQAIIDKVSGNISRLNERKKDIEKELEDIKNLSMVELLDYDLIDEVFRTVNNVSETGVEDKFISVKESQYFSLLKFLVSRGYIDESYSDYMSFFYPNTLTLRDKVFVRSVLDRKSKPFDYCLVSPELVIENLDDFYFSHVETLNFDLSEFLLLSNKYALVELMVRQLERGENFKYIEKYMSSNHSKLEMVVAICKYWSSMFSVAFQNKLLSSDTLREFSRLILIATDLETCKMVNINKCLARSISEDSSYLSFECDDLKNFTRALIELDVRFRNIDSVGMNQSLFDEVYKNDLYAINETNICLMLKEKCSIEDFGTVMSHLFSFIILRAQELSLSAYLWRNANLTMNTYLNMLHSDIDDDNEVVVQVLNNNDIEMGGRLKYLEHLKTKITDISKVSDSNILRSIMQAGNVLAEYNTKNILFYFSKYGLLSELISFINRYDELLDYSKNEDQELNRSFLVSCLSENELRDIKYQQIVMNLCEFLDGEFNVKELAFSKLLILIKNKLIPMNIDNLQFMRGNYKPVLFDFIKYNTGEYVSLINNSTFSFEETIEILRLDDFTDMQKISLLSNTRKPVQIRGTVYSEKLYEYILMNNFDKGDIPWMLQEYYCFSQQLQTLVMSVMKEHIEIVCNSTDNISDELLLEFFRDDEIDFNDKIRLFENSAQKMSIDRIIEVLNILGGDKIANNLEGGNKQVDVNDHNESILNLLLRLNIIIPYEKLADGKHYKKIRKKTSEIIET